MLTEKEIETVLMDFDTEKLVETVMEDVTGGVRVELAVIDAVLEILILTVLETLIEIVEVGVGLRLILTVPEVL